MKVTSNVLVNFVSQALIALLSFAFVPFYLAQLGEAAYGVVGLFAIAQTLCSLFDIGIGQFLTKEIVSDDGRLAGIHFARMTIRLFLFAAIFSGCLLFLLSDILSYYFFSPDFALTGNSLGILLAIMGILVGVRSVESIYKSVFSGINCQGQYNFIFCFFNLLKVAGLILLLPLWSGYGLLVFFGWQLICALVLILTLRYRLLMITKYHVELSLWKFGEMNPETYKFIASASLLYFLSMIYTQLDKIVLARSISLSEFGLYTLTSTAAAAVGYLSLPVMQAMYPEFCFAVATKNYKSLGAAFQRSSQLVSSLVSSLVAMGTLFAQELLLLWTRSTELTEAISVSFVLLLLVNSFIALAGLPNYLLIAMGRVNLLQNQTFFQIVIYLILLFYLVPRYGVLGACSSWLIVSFIYLAFILPKNLNVFFTISGLKLGFLHDLIASAVVSFGVALAFKIISQRSIFLSSINPFFFLGCIFATSLIGSVLVSQSLKEALLAKFAAWIKS